MVDILIPLGSGSISNNDELKLALRSIDKYTDVNRVFIITTEIIPWLTNVNIVRVPDMYTNNKDKNLITKIVRTLEEYPDIDDFAFWTDDNIVTKPLKLAELPNVYNTRGLSYFKAIKDRSKWQNRLYNTLTILNLLGYDVSCNWDAHTPALYNRQKILDGIKSIDWAGSAGNYTISTFFAYLCGFKKDNAIVQDEAKRTYEHPPKEVTFDKLFIGFNDNGFLGNLREALFKEFDEPSKYELKGPLHNNKTGVLVKNVNKDNVSNILKIINNVEVVIALDDTSYNTLKNNDIHVSYIPTTGLNILQIVKVALNVASCLVEYCAIIDGNYNYKDNYIQDNISNLNEDIVLCITDALDSFNCSLFKPDKIYEILDKIDSINNINNLGAFLIDKGARPAVIVNNAT